MACGPIYNNCSLLNSYHYEKKSKTSSLFDILSMPCRKILGGVDISISPESSNGVYSHVSKSAQASTASRLGLLFLSTLIFPVGIVSTLSLVVKKVCLERETTKVKSAVDDVIAKYENYTDNEPTRMVLKQIFHNV